MKKHLIFLLLFLYCLAESTAQDRFDSGADTLRVELGFNASPLFQKLVSPQSQFNSLNETLLLANFKVGEKAFLRSGFNVNFTKTDFPDDNFTQSSNSSNIGARLGMEWRTNVSRTFQVHYGFDVLYRYQQFEFISQSFDGFGNLVPFVSTNESNTVGFGPVLGITWWMSDRIGIFTETGFYIQQVNEKNGSTFDGTEEIFNETSSWRGSSFLPTAIYLKIKL